MRTLKSPSRNAIKAFKSKLESILSAAIVDLIFEVP
jgi:hypothetical protein